MLHSKSMVIIDVNSNFVVILSLPSLCWWCMPFFAACFRPSKEKLMRLKKQRENLPFDKVFKQSFWSYSKSRLSQPISIIIGDELEDTACKMFQSLLVSCYPLSKLPKPCLPCWPSPMMFRCVLLQLSFCSSFFYVSINVWHIWFLPNKFDLTVVLAAFLKAFLAPFFSRST